MKGNTIKDCRTCSELPQNINCDTILDVTKLAMDEFDQANILVVKKRKKLWIIGDDSRIYENFTFVLQEDSSLLLDSFNLEGTQEHIPLIITGNNCKISGRNRSSITVRNDLMAMQIENKAKGTVITVEDEESVFQFCGVTMTYNLGEKEPDKGRLTLLLHNRKSNGCQSYDYGKVLPYVAGN